MNAEFLEHLYREKLAIEEKISEVNVKMKKGEEHFTSIIHLSNQQLFLRTTIRVYIETHRHWKHENG
jgi:hypothetical protein